MQEPSQATKIDQNHEFSGHIYIFHAFDVGDVFLEGFPLDRFRAFALDYQNGFSVHSHDIYLFGGDARARGMHDSELPVSIHVFKSELRQQTPDTVLEVFALRFGSPHPN